MRWTRTASLKSIISIAENRARSCLECIINRIIRPKSIFVSFILFCLFCFVIVVVHPYLDIFSWWLVILCFVLLHIFRFRLCWFPVTFVSRLLILIIFILVIILFVIIFVFIFILFCFLGRFARFARLFFFICCFRICWFCLLGCFNFFVCEKKMSVRNVLI